MYRSVKQIWIVQRNAINNTKNLINLYCTGIGFKFPYYMSASWTLTGGLMV
jgi:hypothetical protein